MRTITKSLIFDTFSIKTMNFEHRNGFGWSHWIDMVGGIICGRVLGLFDGTNVEICDFL